MDVTLAEAARRLGISTEAVRKRFARGLLPGRREGRRLYITLPDEPTPTPDTSPPKVRPKGDATVAALQQTIDILTAQLHEKDAQLRTKDEQIRRAQEAEAEQRRMLAVAMQQRTLELSAPAAQPANQAEESAPRADDGRTGPQPPQPAQPPARSWIARLFGR